MQSISNSLSPSNKKPPLRESFFEALNQEQREAVLTKQGPLFVLAGAGTGKTRVIACRIAHLLQTEPLQPANILALTFSRKAAQEMLERVEGIYGAYADELGVFTFHGFCHRFLQDHSVELGLPARLRLLDKVDSWHFFRTLLQDFKLFYHWNRADPTGCIDGFLRFIHRAKDELVSPSDLQAHVQGLQDPQERARSEEIARVYRIYQDRMRACGNLDFGDLIVETLGALRLRAALLAQLRSRYRAILVDEFQDTNVAQVELLKLLVGSEGNLCVVGDDDQAIYRFRGASFASFLLLKQAFPHVRTVGLTRNYRSTQTILSVADRLIRHNEPDRYDPEKCLRTDNAKGAPVEVIFCRDEVDEARTVVDKIRQLLDTHEMDPQRLDSLAVLYRAHAHRLALVEALLQARIPFSARGGAVLFEIPEIEDVRAFLSALQDPSDSVSIFRLMMHPAWGISDQDLILVGQAARQRQSSFSQILSSAEGLEVSSKTKASLSKLSEELERFRSLSLRIGVEQLVPRVVEESFLCLNFRLPPGSLGDPLKALARFLHLAQRYARNYPSANRLPYFLEYLDSAMRAGEEVPEDEEEDSGRGVRLMTVHQAKGLEFDWVILLSMVQGRFPGRSRPEPIPFPVELMKEPLPKGDYHLQEERRLCYVACTRSRRGLFLLTQDRPRQRPSLFIREMGGGGSEGDLIWQDRGLSEETREQAPTLGAKARVGSPSLEKERRLLEIFQGLRDLLPEDEDGFHRGMREIERLIQSVRGGEKERPSWGVNSLVYPPAERFSFTQLKAYQTCPLKYLYGYVYRIPVRPTPQMAFGTDLHECLEKFFNQIMQDQIPSLEELLGSFRRFALPGRYGEPGQEDSYRRLGEEILRAFYARHEGRFGVPLFVEKPFTLSIGDASLHGVIDRVDPMEGGGVEIVDYKSGKPKETATFEDQLQLWLYALAAKEVLGLEPRRVSFYYLQNNRQLSFDREPETLEETKRQTLGIVRQIQSSQFAPTPARMKCRWCDFQRICPSSAA